jgi:hypothetical protein
MSKINFRISIPDLFLHVFFAPLLLFRRRKFGYSFMRIKLKQNSEVLNEWRTLND